MQSPVYQYTNIIPNLTTENRTIKRIIAFNKVGEPNEVFSNFYRCPVYYEGKLFGSSEHLYHWFKYNSDNPLHREYQEVIRTATTPYIAKMYGKQATKFKHYAWSQHVQRKIDSFKQRGLKPIDTFDNYKEVCMYLAREAKYNSCPEFRHTLMATEDIDLAKWSGDDFWGIGGQNVFGKLLMNLREEKRATYIPPDNKSIIKPIVVKHYINSQ